MPQGKEIILRAQHLAKTFRSKTSGETIRALNDASLEVQQGEIFAVLGPNGAGKTTFINCLAQLLTPDAGSIELFGLDAFEHKAKLRKRFNLSSGHANFSWCMTPEELFRFYGFLYGVRGASLRKKMEELFTRLDLNRFRHRRFDELSTGTKQRFALAKALINDPELLFLDEPTVGLDPDVANALRQFILELNRRRGITIVLTSHYMAEVEELAQRIAFLRAGTVRGIETPQSLLERFHAQDLEQVFLELAREGID